MRRQTLSIAVLSLAFLVFSIGAASAGPNDGGHFFSIDQDTALGGVNGQINHSAESGQYVIGGVPVAYPQNDSTAELDALSSGTHPTVDLWDMYYGAVNMVFSIDGESDIYEWGLLGDVTGAPKSGGLDGHFPNLAPHTTLGPLVHDDESALGLGNQDLDALESDFHNPLYPNPFPTHGIGPVYYSTERATVLDNGDIYYDDGLNPPGVYLNDTLLANLGIDPDTDQLDALIVFDLALDTSFDEGGSLLTSDAIFFSLAPGGADPVGDNIYWYSAYNGGTGGLYFDPGLQVNVDALDVHPVPEPATLSLFTLGLLGLGARRLKRGKTG